MKLYLSMGLVFTLCLAGLWFGIQAAIKAEHRATLNECKLAEKNSEHEALLADVKVIADAYKETQNHLYELSKTADPSRAPASVDSTFARMCAHREKNAVPCRTPRPPAKPSQQ